MTVEFIEYWKLKCDRCGRYLINPKTDNARFYVFDEMADCAKNERWKRIQPAREYLCSQCAIERDIELNEKPPVEV